MIATYQPITWMGMIFRLGSGENLAIESEGFAFARLRTETKFTDPVIGYDEHGFAIMDDRLLRQPASLSLKVDVAGTERGFPAIRYKLALPEWFNETSDRTTAKSPDAPAETL